MELDFRKKNRLDRMMRSKSFGTQEERDSKTGRLASRIRRLLHTY